jgi:hypothetical protein
MGRRNVQYTTEILNNHTYIPLKCKTNRNIFTKGGEVGGEGSGRRGKDACDAVTGTTFIIVGETENLLF